MRKIISIILIGLMTVGCGKTARLERDRLEAAQEQARLAAEADRLANRSYWKMFKDHVWTYKERFATGAVITLAIATSYYFFYKPKQQNLQGNTPPGANAPAGQSGEDPQNVNIPPEDNQPDFGAEAPPSSTETIQQIEDGNLLPQGVQEQAQIPAPPAQNLIVENVIIPPPLVPHVGENTHLVGENPQPQTLTQINKPINQHSLIGMPNLNKPKSMLALTYQPTPTPIEPIVIPEQVATFLNHQPVNHPWLPNSGVFNEPFIQYYEKTFKQKPILMLTYDQKPETQIEGLQNVNTNQHIDIRQQVAEYALMEANHTEPIIVEVPRVLGNAQAPIQTVVIPPQVATNFVRLLQILNPFNEPFIPQVPVDFSQTYVRKARDPLLDEALFAIYGDKRGQWSRYDNDVNEAISLYAWGWQHDELPENRRVPWIRYTQAIWEKAIAKWDQRRLHGIPRPPRPVYPWLPIEEKTRQEKAAEERWAAASTGEKWYIDDAVYKYAWGCQNVNAPIRVNWMLHTRAIWEKAIAKWERERDQRRQYPPRPVPPWELKKDAAD